MAIGSKSFGYWRAMLLASSPLLALAPNMSAQAQQASATVPASTAGTPAAKQTNGDQLDEVIVTGYAASLQTALDNKRKSVLPIESVVLISMSCLKISRESCLAESSVWA